jgi:hypothetical protein
MRKTPLFAVLGLVLLLAPAVRADDDIDQKALDRAHDFLKTSQRGRDVLSFVHFGAKYEGHKYKESRFVVDQNGNRIPGRFALVYAFDWENGGATDVAFLCDRRGNVYGVRALETNAILSQPFVLANASIKLLGNALIAALGDNMTAADKRQAQQAVDGADAKGLLEMSLKLQQAWGK